MNIILDSYYCLRGAVVWLTWFFSMFTVNLVQTIVLPIQFFNMKLGHSISTGYIHWFWRFWITVYRFFGFNTIFTGDCDKNGRIMIPSNENDDNHYHHHNEKKMKNENVFLLSNHRRFPDWFFIATLANGNGIPERLSLFVKYSVLYIPFVGYCLKLLGWIYVRRNWQKDQKSINKTFQFLRDLNTQFWLVSFAEGTRLTPEKLKQSQSFEKRVGLPVLDYVMMPRVKGFVATCLGMGDRLDAVYDVTMGYEGEPPPGPCEPLVFLRFGSGVPINIHYHVRRFDIRDVPLDQGNQAMAAWCFNVFAEKNELLKYFYKHGHFPQTKEEEIKVISKATKVDEMPFNVDVNLQPDNEKQKQE